MYVEIGAAAGIEVIGAAKLAAGAVMYTGSAVAMTEAESTTTGSA